MNLRNRLVQRVRSLPEAALPELDRLIDSLEYRRTTSSIISDGKLLARSLPSNEVSAASAGNRTSSGVADAGTQNDVKPHQSRSWPHAPMHRISEHGTSIVTAGTFHKERWFRVDEQLTFLEGKLLELTQVYGWDLEAWAVFPNHYHFVGHSRPESQKLNVFLGHLHSVTATEINRQHRLPGQQIWYNFWDTQLTFEKSYLARLNYVHQNAVHHGLVTAANQYRWCSAAWFERTATRAQVATIYGFRLDRVKVFDEFDV